MCDNIISVKELIKKAGVQLDLLGYSNGTKKQYHRKWNHLLKYAEIMGFSNFSKKLGGDFLIEHYGINTSTKLSASEVHKVRSILILGELLDHNKFFLCHQKQGAQAPDQFLDILTRYEGHQLSRNILRKTINAKMGILIRFFNFLHKQGLLDIRTISSGIILKYFCTLDKYSQSTKSSITFTIRSFLEFINSHGNINKPVKNLFSTIFTQKDEKIPSYYSPEEINKILNHVDRDTEYGRRDYLVIILAIQLGMRAGDIRQLKFNDIKLGRNTIEFVQQKTKNPLQLPITNELKFALADYAKNSRPLIDNPCIFIRHKAPFIPFVENNTFYAVINKYMILAEINSNNRKHGLHSMRHSSASLLLKTKTPYPVISGILGHKNINTTKTYLRIDIEQLRTVALEVNNGK